MDLIIKNGKIVTADKTYSADIGIKNEKIMKIEKNIKTDAAEIIDAKNKYIFPGGIDVHVHCNLFVCNTYSEDWDTGTQAAACGGLTTVIDFAVQTKGKTIKEAEKLTKQNLAKAVGGLPKIKLHCSVLAVDALKKAIEDYRKRKK